MHMVPNVTVIYCFCEILLLLENYDTHCLSVEFLNLDRMGCQCIPYINYEYITNVTFTTVTLQARSKCYTREEIAFKLRQFNCELC